MTPEELSRDLHSTMSRAMSDWYRDRPRIIKADEIAFNVTMRILSFCLTDTMCRSLFGGGPLTPPDKRSQEAIAKCHRRLVTAVSEHVIPALREDLERMGLDCSDFIGIRAQGRW